MDNINLIKYNGDLKYFKEGLDVNNNNCILLFELVNSYNKLIKNNNIIKISSKNIVFEYFLSLENNIDTLYFPIFICLNTNVENVYIIKTYKLKQSIPLIYKLKKKKNDNNNSLCKMYKINVKDFDPHSIDTYIHANSLKNNHNILNESYNKIFKGYIPKNIISFNFGNDIRFIQENYFIYPNLSNYIIYKAISPHKSNYIWSKVKKWHEKKNYIIYPATITEHNDKNQIKFAQLIDSKIIEDYTIIFTGNQSKSGYNKKEELRLIKILNKKNIKYKVLKCNDAYDFFDILVSCKFLIFYGVNPVDRVRSLTEGLYANLPFIINDKVTTLPKSYFNYGYNVKNNDKNDLNFKIKNLINKDWGLEPYLFTKEKFQIDNISKDIIKEINKIVK